MCNIDTVQNISVTSQHIALTQTPTPLPITAVPAAPSAPKCVSVLPTTLRLLFSPTRAFVLQTLVCID